jgi:NAD(P)-dependent dehydrogenase (short-subunit alcohol dehydrogenase family)
MDVLYLTGSSGGLGQAIRTYFLERGWSVAGFDRSNDGFTAPNYRYINMDSTNEGSVRSAFSEAARTLAQPRTLIATIGGLRQKANVDEMTLDDFRFVTDINMTSLFLTSKYASEMMRRAGNGSIITIGAETALRPEAGRSAYIAAKAAVIAFTQSLALETKEYNTNANCIVPTVIHTKANEEWGALDDIPKWTNPRDIAGMCYYLSTSEGKAVNGAVIRIPNKM